MFVVAFNLFEHHTWEPFAPFGLTNKFWIIHADTLMYTWIAILIMIGLTVFARYAIKRPETVAGALVESYIRAIMNMVTQTLEHFRYRYCAFIGSIFTYILICNVLVVLPFMEEPTKDLNTTLALAIISFIYVQREAIKAHGLFGYLKELSKPIVLFFPLEVLGKLATIISLSFRLFGNIFGGSVICTMWSHAVSGSIIGQLAGLLLGINLIITLFFGIFEGLIQAFVFSILSLTYLTMSISEHNE